MLTEREIPKNIEAEEAVLSAMLLEREAIETASEILKPEDFFREAHKIIFVYMQKLYEKNEPVDLNTITDILKTDNKLDNIGGIPTIVHISSKVFTTANVKYHAQIVKEKSQLRQLINVGNEITETAYVEDTITPDVLKNVAEKVMGISNTNGLSTFSSIHDITLNISYSLSRRMDNNRRYTGIPTGIKGLDKLTSGLQPSDFVILAARPSMGKTALALNIAQNVALRSHFLNRRTTPYTVAIFSLEMSKEQLVNRMLCSEGNIDSSRLKISQLSDDEWNRFWEACDNIAGARIFIDDTPGINAMQLRSKAKRLQAEHGLDFIVIDYLQLMEGSSKYNDAQQRHLQIAEVSRAIKALARELNVPILALSQLSRNVESREIKRPVLSDLRSSGSLEQDADVVAFIYREDYYEHTGESTLAELIVAKHRNGPVDTVYLDFYPSSTTFKDHIGEVKNTKSS